MSEQDDVLRFEVPPIVKKVRVRLEPQAAFNRFTEGIGQWWPLASHSVFREESASCTIEPREGGKIIEYSSSGERCSWGIVERWEPPERIVLKWHAGRPETEAQRVELHFSTVESGLTEVVLIHSGWENLGRAAEATRNSYENGWPLVLERAFGIAEAGA